MMVFFFLSLTVYYVQLLKISIVMFRRLKKHRRETQRQTKSLKHSLKSSMGKLLGTYNCQSLWMKPSAHLDSQLCLWQLRSPATQNHKDKGQNPLCNVFLLSLWGIRPGLAVDIKVWMSTICEVLCLTSSPLVQNFLKMRIIWNSNHMASLALCSFPKAICIWSQASLVWILSSPRAGL